MLSRMRMTEAKALEWFEEIAAREIAKTPTGETVIPPDEPWGGGLFGGPSGGATVIPHGGDIDVRSAAQWLSEAGTAIVSVFGSTHPITAQWKHAVGPVMEGKKSYDNEWAIGAARGVFDTAHGLLRAGRISSLVDAVKAGTVVEVLDQATDLADAGHTVAAVVLAGGALETHLRHLCDRAGLLSSFTGHGTIDRYKSLLDGARKAGSEVISKGDGKLVTAWADDRNAAAHAPTTFSKDADEVKLMISGIRQFVARTE